MKRFLSVFVCVTMLFVLGGGVLAAENDGPEMELICDKSEHTHSDECYETVETEELTCELEESPVTEPVLDPETGEANVAGEGHTHGDGCYTTVETENLICGLEEHTHGDECYETVENTVEEALPTQPVASNILSTPEEDIHDIKFYHISDAAVAELRETWVQGQIHPEDAEKYSVIMVALRFGKGTKAVVASECLTKGYYCANAAEKIKEHQPEDLTEIVLRFYNGKKTVDFPIAVDQLTVGPYDQHTYEHDMRTPNGEFAQITLRAELVQLLYDANAGEDAVEGMPEGVAFQKGAEASVNQGAAMEREGYVFLGWDTDPNATTPAYPAGIGSTIILDETTTLYAIWEKKSLPQPADVVVTVEYVMEEEGHTAIPGVDAGKYMVPKDVFDAMDLNTVTTLNGGDIVKEISGYTYTGSRNVNAETNAIQLIYRVNAPNNDNDNDYDDDDDDNDEIIEEEVEDNEAPLANAPGNGGQQAGSDSQISGIALSSIDSGAEEEIVDEEVPMANLPEQQPEEAAADLPKTGGTAGTVLAILGLAAVSGGVLLRRKENEKED